MDDLINVNNYDEIIRIAEGGTYETVQPKFEEVVYVTTVINNSSGGSGTSGQTIYNGTAEYTLGGHRVVALHNSLVGYADNTVLTDVDAVLGITTTSSLIGTEVEVVTAGEVIESSWNWDTSKTIYLGAAGSLTQTVPTSGFIMKIGYPILPTSMIIELGIPFILI